MAVNVDSKSVSSGEKCKTPPVGKLGVLSLLEPDRDLLILALTKAMPSTQAATQIANAYHEAKAEDEPDGFEVPADGSNNLLDRGNEPLI